MPGKQCSEPGRCYSNSFQPSWRAVREGCLSSWLDATADDVNIRWTRDLAEVMRPFTTGSDYVNQIGRETEEGSERIKAAFGANQQRDF